jgi:DNA-binding response OmpR family regulator
MPPDPDHWVLILDRDVKSLVRLTELIGLEGLSVQTAADLDEALETLQEDPRGCLLVLVAAHASQDDTCDTIGALMQYNRDHGTAVAVLGDEQTRSQLRACRAAGALDLIAKPVAPCDLRDLLHGLPRRGSSPPERHETVLAEAEPPVHTP